MPIDVTAHFQPLFSALRTTLKLLVGCLKSRKALKMMDGKYHDRSVSACQ